MTIIREFLSTVFIIKDKKVLMTWNKKVKTRIPVGGHIKLNKLPCDSVIREAKEESGLDIELISPCDNAKTGNLIQPVHLHLDHIKDNHDSLAAAGIGRDIVYSVIAGYDNGVKLMLFNLFFVL